MKMFLSYIKTLSLITRIKCENINKKNNVKNYQNNETKYVKNLCIEDEINHL